MPHYVASDLVLYYMPVSYKKDTRLIWANEERLVGHLKEDVFKNTK